MADITAHAAPTTDRVRIRRARRSDFDAIRRHHLRTFEEHAAREPSFKDEAPFIDEYLAQIARPFGWLRDTFSRQRQFVLVADVGGTVVGHIAYTRHSNNLGPYAAVVSDISIDPAWRRTGLGQRLVEAMERREARDGVTGFAAGVWPENRASQHLFASLGYAPFQGSETGGGAQTLVQKSIEFGNLPLVVLSLKSAALTLLVIAVLHQLTMTFIG